MTLTRFSPLRDFVSLREAMDRLFEDSFVSPSNWTTLAGNGTRYMPLDIFETPNDIVVRAVVPGVDPEALDVQYQQGTLTLRAKATAPQLEEGSRWYIHEIGAGEFMRQVTLPREVDVEQAHTSFENGVLTLTLPKTPDARPKQIRINTEPQITSGATS